MFLHGDSYEASTWISTRNLYCTVSQFPSFWRNTAQTVYTCAEVVRTLCCRHDIQPVLILCLHACCIHDYLCQVLLQFCLCQVLMLMKTWKVDLPSPWISKVLACVDIHIHVHVTIYVHLYIHIDQALIILLL